MLWVSIILRWYNYGFVSVPLGVNRVKIVKGGVDARMFKL